MRLARPLTVVSLALGVAFMGSASAASKPVCKLLTDPSGNGSVAIEGPVATPNDNRLDILSADIAASSSKDKTKKITAVIRMAQADGTSPSPGGTSHHFYFKHPDSENRLFLEYFTGSELFAESFSVGYDDPVTGLNTLAGATGFVKNNEIHITGLLTDFNQTGGAAIKPGDKLTDLEAVTSVNGVVVILYANTATSTASYTVGAKSCVTPGK